jgi:glycosyltransferase involved in cell wall biosynthesis
MRTYEKDNILILVPGLNARGGITNYYRVLKPLFRLPVTYFERGSRSWPNRKNTFAEFYRIFKDSWKFFNLLRKNQFALVQTTTSFSYLAIFRDAVFILIARIFKCRIIVFFRGWDEKFVQKVEKNSLWLFKRVYFKADSIIELSKDNVERLKKWGYKNQVYLETTVVEKESIQEVSERYLQNKYDHVNSKLCTILFLSRIETSKGIYEAIETFRLLQSKYIYLKMIIAGDGLEENDVRSFVAKNNISNITFTGFVVGDVKKKLFMDASIYLFPSYSEGMPTSVLEAMAFGLPVITRPVGGIPDFFTNGVNGFYNKSKNPVVFADLIEKLLLNRSLMKKIAINNFNCAQNRFLSNIVVERVEEIFRTVINS